MAASKAALPVFYGDFLMTKQFIPKALLVPAPLLMQSSSGGGKVFFQSFF
jgi:hypothetical protein